MSNKGQLSAWRIAETADLQSIVQTHYRQGSKMLLADPLSRLCSPSSGFFDPTLPAKLQALLRYLPEDMKNHENVRVYAFKDTAALSRHIQQWRTPKNPISQGRLSSATAKNSFHIGILHSDGNFRELLDLLEKGQQFAILCPIGVISQLSRKENDAQNQWKHDEKLDTLIHNLSKVVLSQDNQVWLINLSNSTRFVDVLTSDYVGVCEDQIVEVMLSSLNSLMSELQPLPDWDVHNSQLVHHEHLVQTRSGEGNVRPPHVNPRIARSMNNVSVEPIASWIGTQLEGQCIPKTLEAQLRGDHPGFPKGLLVLVTSDKGAPRILVPRHVQYDLVTQAHLDIHHQHYRKVHKLLRPIYYWPSMDDDIAAICKRCTICQLAKVRRQKLQTDFDSLSPQSTYKPRQHYGIDFYGLQGGEILVMVDLFTRETLLEWLPSRKQNLVVQIVMRRIIFERGVPFSIRSDNAPELMKGVVRQLCSYLNISQILTGGHNPRGNAICERSNQTLGAMLRKLDDQQYKNVKFYIPAFQFAMNTTPHSAIGCSPFEAGHGLPASTLSSARLLAARYPHNSLEGQEGDDNAIEDSEPGELQGKIKDLIELAMRMVDVAKATSEWHRRMTSDNLSQNGKKINLEDYRIGSEVYFYKPPTALESEKKGRKAKHMDHYAGPAKIIKQIGKRSFLIEFMNAKGKSKVFQRDAGMLSLINPTRVNFEPVETVVHIDVPHKHRSLTATPLREGEIVLLKDGSVATDWYCAQVLKVLPTHIVVHYYTTQCPPHEDYAKANHQDRKIKISTATFFKTWCLNRGRGSITITPPEGIGRTRDIWSGKIKIDDLQESLLVRNVVVKPCGKLSELSCEIASKLKYPHHQGA